MTRRGAGIELRRGPFDAALDGEVVATIERGRTIEVQIVPGRHTLQVRAGRYSSRSRSFDATDGEAVDLRCHGAMVWPRYVASFVKPDVALSLRRE